MRPDSPLAHAKHIFRVGLLLIVGAVALVLGRSLFVPETWGQYGHYRGGAVLDHKAPIPRHGGNESCAACHEDEFEEVMEAGHASLACESCHAPLSVHAANDEKWADMPIRRNADLCLLCHERLDGRPADHPQINRRQHVEEEGGEMGPESCFDCHEVHAPI